MTGSNRSFERAMTLAALSGLKIALGPAFLRTSQRRRGAENWVVAALGEMALDKLGVFPPRYRPALLIPHALAGAWVANESLKADGVEEPLAGPMGAVVAAGVSAVVPMVRMTAHRALGVPDWMLGLAEDYVAVKYGSQAVGLSMDQVGDVARDAVEGLSGQVRPALESIRSGA